MGNSSSHSPKLTPEQEDLKFLGERFPFGDDELRHLYTAFHAIHQDDEERTSFLVDWAVHCAEPTTREERHTLLQVVECEILPADFGNQMYQAAFLVPGDTCMYTQAAEASTTTSRPAATDAYTRRARLERFFDGISNSGRRGSKQALTVLFDTCYCREERNRDAVAAADAGSPKTIRAQDLVNVGYRIALSTAFLQAAEANDGVACMQDYIPSTEADDDSERTLQALTNSIVERAKGRQQRFGMPAEDDYLSEGLVELEDLLEWADSVAPVFASILPTFMFQLLFPGRTYPPSRTPFEFPRILNESTFFSAPTSPLLFTFGCLSSSLDGAYYRLYTSATDGLSFNRLQNSLLGYSGPTLLLIREATNHGVFGAFTASPWKEAKDFYGNSDCFLFQMAPTTVVLRPTGNSHNYMYCNSTARSRGYDQQAHGIGFGGTVQEPRLFIEETFDHCVAGSRDLTFENGSLLPRLDESSGATQTKYFEIDSLEVWGVGGDEVVQQALGARAEARNVKEEGIRRARKVDKAAFLDDLRSGIIESKAFKHREQIQGRADEDVKERYRKSYDYEK